MTWVIAIVTGIVVSLLVYSLKPVREGKTGVLPLTLLGVLGSVLTEWLFGYVLGIYISSSFLTGFRWDALIWGVVGSVIFLAAYESYLYQPSSASDKASRYEREPYTSYPIAHDYNDRSRTDSKDRKS